VEHRIHLPLVDARADLDAGLHAVADFQTARPLGQRGDETIVNRLLDNRPRSGRALLARREE